MVVLLLKAFRAVTIAPGRESGYCRVRPLTGAHGPPNERPLTGTRTAMNAPVDVDLKTLATTLPLEDLDPSDPRIYYEDVWQPFFERFRREAPVHRVLRRSHILLVDRRL